MLKRNMVYGIFGIGVNKGNYNASFDKDPKCDDNGIMYATPQCIQYAIKHQLQKDGGKVLFKKSVGEKGVRTLKESFENLIGISLDEKNLTEREIKRCLLNELIDVPMFGCTFTGKGHISIMGAIQINFATNRYENTSIIVDDILSPFSNPKSKDKEEGADEEKAKAGSLGTQVIVDEAHYTHSFTVNPFEYDQYKEEIGFEGFTEELYNKFKQASLIAVSNYNSRAKSGCQNEFALFVEAKDEELNKINLNGLDQYITLNKDIETDKVMYDLTRIAEILNNFKDSIKGIEIYYNPYKLNLKGDIEKAKVFNIITRKEI